MSVLVSKCMALCISSCLRCTFSACVGRVDTGRVVTDELRVRCNTGNNGLRILCTALIRLCSVVFGVGVVLGAAGVLVVVIDGGVVLGAGVVLVVVLDVGVVLGVGVVLVMVLAVGVVLGVGVVLVMVLDVGVEFKGRASSKRRVPLSVSVSAGTLVLLIDQARLTMVLSCRPTGDTPGHAYTGQIK